MSSTDEPSVFNYTDYRKYLLDYYTFQKQQHSYFSYRYFARKAGITSVGLYKDIAEGRQCLGRGMMVKFSATLKHSLREAEYFEAMVFFNEANTIEERKLYFDRMMALVHPSMRVIEKDRYEYYAHWYYPAMRALLSIETSDGSDYKRLSKLLNPPIRALQAKKAIEVLSRLGIIAKNPQGVYQPTESLLTTGAVSHDKQVHATNVLNFQKSMIALANEAYSRAPSAHLDMSTVTISVSPESMKQIKNELASFRQKVMSIAKNEPRPSLIYELNCQFFPLTANKESANG